MQPSQFAGFVAPEEQSGGMIARLQQEVVPQYVRHRHLQPLRCAAYRQLQPLTLHRAGVCRTLRGAILQRKVCSAYCSLCSECSTLRWDDTNTVQGRSEMCTGLRASELLCVDPTWGRPHPAAIHLTFTYVRLA